LFDYVSFANEPLSAITPAPPGRKSKDKSKALKAKAKPKSTRGRGRPPSISEPAIITVPIEDASAPAVGSGEPSAQADEGHNQDATEANEQNNSDHEENEGDADGEADNGEGSEDENNESDGENAQDEGADDKDQHNHDQHDVSAEGASQPMDVAKPSTELSAGSSAPTHTSNPTEPKPLGPDVTLEETHPMLGMWEGTFNVKTATGNAHICICGNVLLRCWTLCIAAYLFRELVRCVHDSPWNF
jgi:hypothetical protein